MAEYVLRIGTSALQKKELTIDEVVRKLQNIEGLTITTPAEKTMQVKYDGTIEDLYALLGYNAKQLVIADLAIYHLPKPIGILKK